jgi:hypothetical protein
MHTPETSEKLAACLFRVCGAVQAADSADNLLKRYAKEQHDRACVALGITTEPTCSRCGWRPCCCDTATTRER